MKMTRLTKWIVAVLLSVPAVAQDLGGQDQTDAARKAAEAALAAAAEEGYQQGSIAPYTAAIKTLVAAGDKTSHEVAMTRLTDCRSIFPPEDLVAICEADLEAHPERADGLRRALASYRLAAAPRDQCAAVYWHGVKHGSVEMVDGEHRSRAMVLTLAAYEGLEEFTDAIGLYAAEIDALGALHKGIPASSEYLWLVRLRSGAANRYLARQRHADSLAAMDPAEFARLMDTDPAFAAVMDEFRMSVCGRCAIAFENDGPCATLLAYYPKVAAVVEGRDGRTLAEAEANPDRTTGKVHRVEWLNELQRTTSNLDVKLRYLDLLARQKAERTPTARPER